VGSKHAAWLMLAALQDGSADDVRVALAGLDRFIPADSTSSESERRDLLEGLGTEAIAHPSRGARNACLALLEHLAGPDRPALTVQ
jgi:hypothetical protein